jgi:hypothetical protein
MCRVCKWGALPTYWTEGWVDHEGVLNAVEEQKRYHAENKTSLPRSKSLS